MTLLMLSINKGFAGETRIASQRRQTDPSQAAMLRLFTFVGFLDVWGSTESQPIQLSRAETLGGGRDLSETRLRTGRGSTGVYGGCQRRRSAVPWEGLPLRGEPKQAGMSNV